MPIGIKFGFLHFGIAGNDTDTGFLFHISLWHLGM